jgi:hypothetical protein
LASGAVVANDNDDNDDDDDDESIWLDYIIDKQIDKNIVFYSPYPLDVLVIQLNIIVI